MTPHKQAGGKNYRLDRTFLGVGRIARASGTTHPGTFKRINTMLSGLYTTGQLDVLAMIRDGIHAPLVVLRFYERGQIDKLPSAETTVSLVPALLKFKANHEGGASYKQDVGTSIRHIEKVATKAASIADLPKILRGLREVMVQTPVAFNRLRAHMLSFASHVQGELSPLWTDIKRVKRFKKAEGQRPKTIQRRPLTVQELDLVCAAFTDHQIKRHRWKGYRTLTAQSLREMAWTMATTGMRPAEYWQRNGATWFDRGVYVQVNGTKTAAAVRPTFRLDRPIEPVCGEQFFRRAFRDATTKALRVALDAYSLRRTFASLCETAGLVESRRKAYLGHGPKTVTDLYLKTNVLPFVEEDARVIQSYIASQRTRVLSIVKTGDSA